MTFTYVSRHVIQFLVFGRTRTAYGTDIRSVLRTYLGVQLEEQRRVVVVALTAIKDRYIYIYCKQETFYLAPYENAPFA